MIFGTPIPTQVFRRCTSSTCARDGSSVSIARFQDASLRQLGSVNLYRMEIYTTVLEDAAAAGGCLTLPDAKSDGVSFGVGLYTRLEVLFARWKQFPRLGATCPNKLAHRLISRVQ